MAKEPGYCELCGDWSDYLEVAKTMLGLERACAKCRKGKKL